VLTIIKRGVEGGETVDSYWLQQEDRKIGGKKHGLLTVTDKDILVLAG